MNVNNVTIIGHLTKDPISKDYENGKPLTTFTVATNRRGKDKQSQPEFHNVVTFGRLAEICRDYLKRGRLVYVQGRLHTGHLEDDKKNKRSKTEVIAKEMLLLDKKSALVRAASEDVDASEALININRVAAQPA